MKFCFFFFHLPFIYPPSTLNSHNVVLPVEYLSKRIGINSFFRYLFAETFFRLQTLSWSAGEGIIIVELNALVWKFARLDVLGIHQLMVVANRCHFRSGTLLVACHCRKDAPWLCSSTWSLIWWEFYRFRSLLQSIFWKSMVISR